MRYKSHKVLKGETLSGIARQYGTTVKAIQEANPNTIKDPNIIAVGWVLKIPVPADYAAIGKQLETALEDVRNLPSVKALREMLEG